jgi:hypothetical protein
MSKENLIPTVYELLLVCLTRKNNCRLGERKVFVCPEMLIALPPPVFQRLCYLNI